MVKCLLFFHACFCPFSCFYPVFCFYSFNEYFPTNVRKNSSIFFKVTIYQGYNIFLDEFFQTQIRGHQILDTLLWKLCSKKFLLPLYDFPSQSPYEMFWCDIGIEICIPLRDIVRRKVLKNW